MEFSNRNVQPHAAAPGAQTTAAGNPAPIAGNKSRHTGKSEWSRIINMLLVLAVVILICAAVALISFGNTVKAESSYVDTTKLQAVFLNTGQVYFGNIKSLNSKYFVVTNIYYLQTSGGSSSTASSTSSANTSVSLVKLGCELHRPFDQMVINSDQVTFWENLEGSGQVAQAVQKFQQQNPKGQQCSDQSSSSASTSNSVQSAGSSSTPATTTPKP